MMSGVLTDRYASSVSGTDEVHPAMLLRTSCERKCTDIGHAPTTERSTLAGCRLAPPPLPSPSSSFPLPPASPLAPPHPLKTWGDSPWS
eukprot:893972-Rhodomonas_salina.2